MHYVARNVFNFVIAADLASARGLTAASAAAEMAAHDYPVRVGVLPSLPGKPN